LIIKKTKRNRKSKPLSQWCHQCKQKHSDILYCSKYYSGSCTKKYCKGCIERHYNESYNCIDKDKWICLFCRNLCVCAFCRRKRGEDVPKKVFKRKKSSSNYIKESPSSPPLKKKGRKINTVKILPLLLYLQPLLLLILLQLKKLININKNQIIKKRRKSEFVLLKKKI